jgi:hypothetical protein
VCWYFSEVVEELRENLEADHKHRKWLVQLGWAMIKEANAQEMAHEIQHNEFVSFLICCFRSRFLQILAQSVRSPALLPSASGPKRFVSRRPPQTGNADSINKIAIRTSMTWWIYTFRKLLYYVYPPENGNRIHRDVDHRARVQYGSCAIPINGLGNVLVFAHPFWPRGINHYLFLSKSLSRVTMPLILLSYSVLLLQRLSSVRALVGAYISLLTLVHCYRRRVL